MHVVVTQEDIDRGREACSRPGNRSSVCMFSQAIMRQYPEYKFVSTGITHVNFGRESEHEFTADVPPVAYRNIELFDLPDMGQPEPFECDLEPRKNP